MNSGQEIQIQLVNGDGRALQVAGVLVNIRLFIGGAFRYEFTAGRTGDAGCVTATYDGLEQQRSTAARAFLMDYNDKLETCDSLVMILVPSERELRSRYESVMRQHRTAPSWALEWPSNSKVEADAIEVPLVYPLTRVSMPSKAVD